MAVWLNTIIRKAKEELASDEECCSSQYKTNCDAHKGSSQQSVIIQEERQYTILARLQKQLLKADR
jgi:hypothetical protein